MSDRLALAEAIEDAGIPRDKAARIASVIFDAIHQNVATKADLEASAASVRTEMRSGFAEVDGKVARVDVAIERVRSVIREMESRLVVRLGGLMVVLAGLLFAALRMWPPH